MSISRSIFMYGGQSDIYVQFPSMAIQEELLEALELLRKYKQYVMHMSYGF
jgi:hypothetical protein